MKRILLFLLVLCSIQSFGQVDTLYKHDASYGWHWKRGIFDSAANFPILSTPPSEGTIYIDSTDKRFRFKENGSWIQYSAGQNFANTNLTFTGDRSHNTAGHQFNLTGSGGSSQFNISNFQSINILSSGTGIINIESQPSGGGSSEAYINLTNAILQITQASPTANQTIIFIHDTLSLNSSNGAYKIFNVVNDNSQDRVIVVGTDGTIKYRNATTIGAVGTYTDLNAQNAVGGILNTSEFTYVTGTSISLNQVPWTKVTGTPSFITTEVDPTVNSWIKSIPAGSNTNQYLGWTGSAWTNRQVSYSQLSGTPTIPTQYTDEMAQDATASLIQNGTGISWVYNDASNLLTPTVTLAPFTTSNLTEGTNLYYTASRVNNQVAALLQPGTGITLNYNAGAGTLTINSSGTGADGNNYPTAVNFNTATGLLSISRNGLADITKNLDGRYVVTESDPTVPSYVKTIPAGTATNQYIGWNGTLWTNRQVSYADLTGTPPSETDPIFVASVAHGINSTNIANWNTAYSFSQLFNISSPLTNQLLQYNGTKWVNWTPNYLTSFTESDPIAVAKTVTVGSGLGINVTGGVQTLGSNPNFTVNVANTGVTAGTYTNIVATINAQGQVTSASNGTAIAALPQFDIGTGNGSNLLSGDPTFTYNGVKMQLGVITGSGTSTATPKNIDLGETSSNANGGNLKLSLFHASSVVYGLGVSPSQMDYVISDAVGAHVFYTNGTAKLTVRNNGTVGFLSYSGSGNVIAHLDASGNLVRGTIDPATIATATNTVTFTNKSGNISQWTNNSGYLLGNQTITVTNTGDVTGSGSGATSISYATTIANAAVTYAKFQTIPATSLLGNSTTGTGTIGAITLGNGLGFDVGGHLANTGWSIVTANAGSSSGSQWLAPSINFIGTGITAAYNSTWNRVDVTIPAGTGSPAGSNTYIQYNNAGAFGASSNFVFNTSTNTATLGAIANNNNGTFILDGDLYQNDPTINSVTGHGFINQSSVMTLLSGVINITSRTGTWNVFKTDQVRSGAVNYGYIIDYTVLSSGGGVGTRTGTLLFTVDGAGNASLQETASSSTGSNATDANTTNAVFGWSYTGGVYTITLTNSWPIGHGSGNVLWSTKALGVSF